jgi:cobalamin synthase
MRNKSLLGRIQRLRVFGSDNHFAQIFDANPHLDWILLAVPLLAIAFLFEAAWAVFAAVILWFAVFVFHLFMGKTPPSEP